MTRWDVPSTAIMDSDRRTFMRHSTVATVGLFGTVGATSAAAADEPADGMGRIEGRLEYGGSPVETVSVAFDDDTSVNAADDGTYQRELEPGSYTLTVDGDGYVAESREIEVGDGETATVDFDLRREWGPEEGELEVIVDEPGGESTVETRARIFGNGREYSTIVPDGWFPDGDRWTRGFVLPEGWWEIHAAGVDGYGDGYEEVYVEADGDAQVAVVELSSEDRTIPRRGLVRGTVTDVLGDPIPDAAVRLHSDRSTWLDTTDADGEFSAELAHGQYELDVFGDGYERVEQSVTVQFGRVTERDVTLEAEDR